MKFPFIQKNKKQNTINSEVDDVLLRALLNGQEIGKNEVLSVPAVASDLDLITGIIASMPIKLYQKKKGKIEEVIKDRRISLLNGDTGDTLIGFHFKKALVEDYFLDKGGYAFIRKSLNNIVGLYYIDSRSVCPFKNSDPIYKFGVFNVNGQTYKNYQFIKLLRDSKDGFTGRSIVGQLAKLFETTYQSLVYQLFIVKNGGNKKGFLQAERKLGKEEIEALKKAWSEMYRSNESNIVVLNNGLSFKESSNSSVEMQLNQSNKTLSEEIHNVFHIAKTFDDTFKYAILPIISNFETELNNVLLLESEKDKFFFKFDISEITKASIKERYEAYDKAIKDGFKTINEIRQSDGLNEIEGLDVVNVGLGSVLYNVKTQQYYTPNTNTTHKNNETVDDDDETNSETVDEGGEN